MEDKLVRIMVVGQTPPPYIGQAMMIDRLVNAKFDRIKIYHVRMCFSNSIRSIGNASLGKVIHLFVLVCRMLFLRFGRRIDVLYYPPAGPNRTPVIRDIILLGMTRVFFRKVVYHFRAAGISDFLERQPRLFRTLAKIAYGTPEASIQLSALNPADGRYFNSNHVYIVPNGLEDAALPYLPLHRNGWGPVNILFVGVLREDKGVTVLLEAARLLKEQGNSFRVALLGEFASDEYEREVRAKTKAYGLSEQFCCLGLKTGPAKWYQYQAAHIFCFPSYFDCESFGNVLVEAMMFELPVVSTLWRGIPDIVAEGETGFLVPVKNPRCVAERLSALINNPVLREKMGEKGRRRYLENFSLQKHLNAIQEVLETLDSGQKAG
ncbi:MAG: glycosyltransferase [Cytophagales bacterium]|jgi:glycosyltransferase involved in cell wall biosynthesis|nr:glycosyltransferase [Cytophagales bacterium]